MSIFLAVFLGTLVAILLIVIIVSLVLWLKVKKSFRQVGCDDMSLGNFLKIAEGVDDNTRNTAKSISDMTNVIINKINTDFPEFSIELIFKKTEEGLRTIFDALSNDDTSKLDSIPFLKNSLIFAINNNKANSIDFNYDDIKFHKFGIRNYEKKDGVAMVSVDTSVGYHYKKTIKGKKSYKGDRYIQTRYTCKFVYVYDETSIVDFEVLGLTCPNCGGPIKGFGLDHCPYCKSGIEIKNKDVNLKAWEMSSYEEY